METFYVVQVVKNNENIMALDYPKDFPIPNVNDKLIIEDVDGFKQEGIVTKKSFYVAKKYRQLTIFLNCSI